MAGHKTLNVEETTMVSLFVGLLVVAGAVYLGRRTDAAESASEQQELVAWRFITRGNASEMGFDGIGWALARTLAELIVDPDLKAELDADALHRLGATSTCAFLRGAWSAGIDDPKNLHEVRKTAQALLPDVGGAEMAPCWKYYEELAADPPSVTIVLNEAPAWCRDIFDWAEERGAIATEETLDVIGASA